MQVSVNLLSILSAFFAGVLVSFTPCVYPFLPITLSYIGAKGAASRLRGFLLSIIYASGLMVTFSLLGIIAALSGRVFGSFTQNAYFYFLIGNIYLLLALSLLDVFTVSFLSLSTLPIFSKAKGYLGIFVIGALSGFVIGPCATPMLGAILTFIVKERNVFAGFILLSSFAFGMSLLLVLVGTFSGLANFLPKSGIWNKRIKFYSAVILILGAEYFLLKAGGLL